MPPCGQVERRAFYARGATSDSGARFAPNLPLNYPRPPARATPHPTHVSHTFLGQSVAFTISPLSSPPHQLTTSPPHHLTISPPPHLTISPPHHLTTSPSQYLTTSPSHHLTISPSPHLTASPATRHLTISPSPHLTISPPRVMRRTGDDARCASYLY